MFGKIILRFLFLALLYTTLVSTARVCDEPMKNKRIGAKNAKAKAKTASACKNLCEKDSSCLFYNFKSKKCTLSKVAQSKKKGFFSGSCYEEVSTAPSQVIFPYKTVPSKENPLGVESGLAAMFPKYTTVFGIPVFGGSEITVRTS